MKIKTVSERVRELDRLYLEEDRLWRLSRSYPYGTPMWKLIEFIRRSAAKRYKKLVDSPIPKDIV